MGTQAQGRAHGHGRVNAVLPDFVTGGGDDSAAVGAADDEGFAGSLGVVALFYRCIEGIHVNMKNSATHGNHLTRWPVRPFIASSTIATRGEIDYRGPCRVIDYRNWSRY